MIKATPFTEDENNKGKFEVSGFQISYEPKKGEGLISKSASNFFPDLPTAMASVNGDKYLMPVANGGFRIVEIISGAPIISNDENQMFRYIDNAWRRL
jgi:hypothetical protein